MVKVLFALVTAAMIGAAPCGATDQSAATASAVAPATDYDRAAALDAVRRLAGALEERFVFPDTARAYAAMLRSNLDAGAYADISDPQTLASTVTADLQAVAPDGHLRLAAPRADMSATTATSASRPLRRRPDPIEQAGWIAPRIAYVRFNAFTGGDEARQVAQFLEVHEGAKALIIDGRTHHGGGLEEMNEIFSRIFSEPKTLMVMETRAGVEDDGEDAPSEAFVRVEAPSAFRRFEHRAVPGPDTSWRTARVYYLISGRTVSAGEHLAAALKGTHRGLLIGETTAGAGNYGGTVELPGGYSAFIPVGRSYFPGSSGWEGTGVSPDVVIAPERALAEALIREGVEPAEAERLSAEHMPSGPMTKR
jgi:hypothetical protein